MSIVEPRAYESEESRADYESRKAKSECMGQGVYCIASIAFFIFAGLISTPSFIGSLPGGELTAALIGIGIFVCVLFLCIQQRPRTNNSMRHNSPIAENQNCPH